MLNSIKPWFSLGPVPVNDQPIRNSIGGGGGGGEVEEEEEANAQTPRLDDVNAKKIDRFFSQRKIPVIGILLSDLGF